MRRITTEEEEGRSADPRRNATDRTPAVAPTAMPIQAQFNTEIELEKMKEFFNQMNNMRFSSDKKEALSIIIDRINNDTPGEPIPTPAGLFESSKSKIRTEIHELLVEFAPESERRKNNGNVYLKKWFEADNLKRYFFYRSKEALVTIAATYFGKRLATSLSYDKLIERLIELASAQSNESDISMSSSDGESLELEEEEMNRNRRQQRQDHGQRDAGRDFTGGGGC